MGIVETYGRPKTLEALQGLEVLPPRLVEYRGATFEELDAEALIARKPEVALIDELAHTNVPGSRRSKRWEDVVDVLAAGISVISTVNIQHLESVNDVVTKITGIRQQETVPDWVVDMADDMEVVDISPSALRRRMLHGNIYPDARKAELALERYFTMDNLTALRRARPRCASPTRSTTRSSPGGRRRSRPETRERVLVCVAYPTFTEDLVRRGARIAQRARGRPARPPRPAPRGTPPGRLAGPGPNAHRGAGRGVRGGGGGLAASTGSSPTRTSSTSRSWWWANPCGRDGAS